MDILAKVIQFTAETHGVDPKTITADTHFFNDFDDSLDYVEIMMRCEESFGIEIDEVEIERLNLFTVGQFASYIGDRLKDLNILVRGV